MSITRAEPTRYSSRYRWVICALLFLATTSNYMDRQILGILAPVLQAELGWSESEYGHIVTAFQAAYAFGLLACGWIVDRIGTRWGLIVAVSLWSVASAIHGMARSVSQFALARFGLGLSEAANFPASIKSVSEWFPQRERALAIGIFNSGSNLGAIIAPLTVPFIALRYGWQTAFFVLGAAGFLWVGVAMALFRSPDASERPIDSNPATASTALSWRVMIRRRETIAFACAKFLTDPVWWFFLYWIPKYLHSTFGLELSGMGVPLVLIYLFADVGSIGGGWWSGRLIGKGIDPLLARRRVMLWCALSTLMVMVLAYQADLWVAVAILSLATAAHQAWSANLFSTVADSVPQAGVASVVGIGGMAGAVGGMLLAQVAGYSLELTGSYVPLFMVCSSAYLVAWGILRSLANRE
jgi:ACS family hexuronate transporter-like MFS transporter